MNSEINGKTLSWVTKNVGTFQYVTNKPLKIFNNGAELHQSDCTWHTVEESDKRSIQIWQPESHQVIPGSARERKLEICNTMQQLVGHSQWPYIQERKMRCFCCCSQRAKSQVLTDQDLSSQETHCSGNKLSRPAFPPEHPDRFKNSFPSWGSGDVIWKHIFSKGPFIRFRKSLQYSPFAWFTRSRGQLKHHFLQHKWK